MARETPAALNQPETGAHTVEPSQGTTASTGVCGCRHKRTPRTTEMQSDLQKRLNRIIGQLNGVKSMIDDNRYCGDVLTQLAAADSALKGVSSTILRNHLETCVVERIKQGDTEVIDEVLQLMRKFS